MFDIMYWNKGDIVKKFGTVVFLSVVMMLSTGCGIGQDKDEYSRFKTTGDKYSISNLVYEAYYDSETSIVYLIDIYRGRGGATVMYNSKGEPMTIEEYRGIK